MIPTEFLEKYDTGKLTMIQHILINRNNKVTYPSENKDLSSSEVENNKPVSQLTDKSQLNSLSLILKKIIYIQYSNIAKRDDVEKIQKIFKNNKWIAPGIECVKGKYTNIIKYFHDEDRDIANEANNLMGNTYKVIQISNPEYEKSVPKGQIEIWISNN